MQSADIFERLVSFPTVSRTSNLALVDYVRQLLEPLGARVRLVSDEADRTNLWVSVGPAEVPGVVLSGHSDVVPVEGQAWSRDPFTLARDGNRLFGRGTADMKGFLACAISCAMGATQRKLAAPLHLSISFDEEIGCLGVRSLLADLAQQPVRPALCWIGEPTSLRLAVGHKGKMAFRAVCTGREAHSALAPSGLNAIHIATDFIAALRQLQCALSAGTVRDDDYEVPYSTVHVGTIHGGHALNIVPASCSLDFEVRNIAEQDIHEIDRAIRDLAVQIVSPLRERFPEAAISIETMNAYPGLNTSHEGALRFMTKLTGTNQGSLKVAFGTEGGLFSERLAIPTVICGPGSMEQGHKPDEFIDVAQLEACDVLLTRLLDQLEIGVTL
jgi:acetylornithine deacetylase